MKEQLCRPFFFMLLLISATGWAQEIGISGKVMDEDKIPLPGVTVRVKDSSLGAVTDFDGNFTLFIPDSDVVLVFSSVGFKKQELRVGDKRGAKSEKGETNWKRARQII